MSAPAWSLAQGSAGERASRWALPAVPAQAALLGLAAFLVYTLALSNGFAYDDVVIVKGDPRVTDFQLWAILSKPYWAAPGFALYRPLVTFSFAVDWAISNGNPAWFHAVNGLWHVLSCVALFLLLRAWFSAGSALLGALLFAVHPVHVEAVANVVGRAELMAAALFLTACALWAHEWPGRRGVRAALVCLLYVLAMLCKESAATLPAILLLIDRVKAGQSGSRAIGQSGTDGPVGLSGWAGIMRERWVEYGVLAGILAAVILLRALLAGGATPRELDPVLEVAWQPGDRIRTALQVWPHIMRLLLFPRVLLADYGPRVLLPADGWSGLVVPGLLILLLLVVGGLLLLGRDQPLAALALLWLPITMLPVANLLFPIGVLLAERTLYVPSVAVSLAVAGLLTHAHNMRAWKPHWAYGVVGVFLILCAIRVQTRIPDWDSTDSVMMAQRRERPESFRAEWHAARMARRDAQPQLGLERYRNALRMWPYRKRLVIEATVYMSLHRDAGNALRLARFGAQRWPNNLELQRLLAAHALDAGDTITARRAIAAGLGLSPKDSVLLNMSSALTPGKAVQ
jgi:protein O-mannosyl-transferase